MKNHLPEKSKEEILDRILESSTSVFSISCSQKGIIEQASNLFMELFPHSFSEKINLYSLVLKESHGDLDSLLKSSLNRMIHFYMPHDFIESFSCFSRVMKKGVYLIFLREKTGSSQVLDDLTKQRNFTHQRLLEALNESTDFVNTLYENSKLIYDYFSFLKNGKSHIDRLTAREMEIFQQINEFQLTAKKNISILESFMASKEISPSTKSQLTWREQEILSLIKEGRSNKEISEILFLSENTVKSHLYRIYKKLNINSRKDIM